MLANAFIKLLRILKLLRMEISLLIIIARFAPMWTSNELVFDLSDLQKNELKAP